MAPKLCDGAFELSGNRSFKAEHIRFAAPFMGIKTNIRSCREISTSMEQKQHTIWSQRKIINLTFMQSLQVKKMEITTMFAMFSWFQIQFSSFNKRWVEKKPDGKGENWEKRNTHLTQILSFLFAISLSYETLQSNFFDLQQQYSGLDFHITFPSFWKWIPTTHIMGYWLRKMKLQLKLFQNLCSTKI